ncbi:hypothetical protein Tco_1458939 [Tanacetum coccineum]
MYTRIPEEKGWQLSGIPCEHGTIAIYFLHKDPKNYVPDWYNKDVFVNAYNHYIEGMNGMDQWPTTGYQNPLPPIVRRMPGRPAHKSKRDAMEDDGNKTKIRTTSVGKVTTSGEIVTTSVGKVIVAGETMTASGGNVGKGWKVTSTPSTPSTPPPGFEMSTSNTASSAMRTNGGAIKLREGVWIRSHKKERSSYADTGSSSINKLRTVNGKVVSSRGRGDGSKSRMYPFGIRPIGFGMPWDPIDGQTMLGSSMGLPRHAWPEGITPQDCIIYAATQSEIALSHSQLVESQEEEPRQQQQPRQ